MRRMSSAKVTTYRQMGTTTTLRLVRTPRASPLPPALVLPETCRTYQDLPAEELQESFDAIDEVVKHWDSSSVVVDRRLD